MKIKKIFLDVKQLLEKNLTNNNLYIDEARFVNYFNFVKNKIQNYYLNKRDGDEIRFMSPYLIKKDNLIETEDEDYFQTFSLPDDYFDFVNIEVKASKGSCKNEILLANEVKAENTHLYLNDENTKPSFLYRETFYHFSEKGVTIYKDDFKISKVYLDYYKKIGEVDIAGYVKEDGTQSTDVDTDIPDNLIPIFVNAIVKAFSQSQGDLNNYQISNNELVSI